MILRSLESIQEMVSGQGLKTDFLNTKVAGVSIDTRSLTPGNLYIPIIRIDDGHKYAQEAIAKGASALLWKKDHPSPPQGIPLIFVEDTLIALQSLAKSYRDQLNLIVIGITGSNGKTTTKDMIYSIVSGSYRSHKTKGNLNGEYGLPLTLLGLEEDTQVVILEMGMSNIGEIELLSEIARPDVAVITMIGISHLSSLGSKEAIALAKLEILKGLNSNGVIIINGDEPLLNQAKQLKGLPATTRCVRFGESESNDLYATCIETVESGIRFKLDNSNSYSIPLLGRHNVMNALASIAVAKQLELKDEEIENGFNTLKISGMRMEVIEARAGFTIINDAWNASPVSMKAAIQSVKELTGYKRKILVLSDMLELGDQEIKYHQEIAKGFRPDEIDFVLTYGTLSQHISNELLDGYPINHVRHFDTKEDLIAQLLKIVRPEDVILLKGSRGMKLEEVLEKLDILD